jgi:diguanylate cyclase (GGDEF)-like protein
LNEELKVAQDQLQTKNTDLAQTNLNLQAQATSDPLTGLPNHRSMVLALDHAIDQAQRYGRPCSVLFLDLDHLKALNDGCGHLAGDTVLREIVDPIVEGLRSADTAGRWGGEEFVVLLPETDIEDATIAAERIRNFVGQREFSVAGGVRLTCSIGVASYPIDATSRDGLIEAADRAMYTAKRLGRNQVRASEGPGLGDVLPGVRKVSSRDEATVWGVVEALSTIVKAHDSIVDAQSQVVSNLSIRVGTALGLSESEVRLTGLAARLHDIGMVSIPQSTLNKTTEFDSSDWSAVVAHPALGADVVTSVPALRVLAPLIRAHHERWDGTGYPDGLEGEEIPMGSRIIAACGAYSAMTRGGRRPPLRSPEEALWELDSCSGTQFDPGVVAALRQVLEEEASEPLKQAG